jgi:hypothetical protein
VQKKNNPFPKNLSKFYVKTSDRNDHFENWRPFKDDPVARLFTWEDCCFRKMKDGWMFLWQPPVGVNQQYSKGFADYDKLGAFDKFADWLSHRRAEAFKEIAKGSLRKIS